MNPTQIKTITTQVHSPLLRSPCFVFQSLASRKNLRSKASDKSISRDLSINNMYTNCPNQILGLFFSPANKYGLSFAVEL